MGGDDGRGTFVEVGRIAVGDAAVDRSAEGILVRMRIRRASATDEPLLGRGADLPEALTACVGPLTKIPVRVAAATAMADAGPPSRVVATVLVGSAASGAARYAQGHADAADEATALAVATLRGLAAGGFLKSRFLTAGARDVEVATERIVHGIESVLDAPPPEAMGAIRELVSGELNRFGAGQAILSAHAADREVVLTRFDAQQALGVAAGATKTSDTATAAWWEWFPGLDNDHRRLDDVLAEMPAAPAAAIPWIVRLFENPRGWLRLHGAVHLAHHDMIHVLLGRGLLDQDEAFVIGFTMGSTRAVSWLERTWFKFVVSHLYPEPYRISRKMLVAYDLGLAAGRECGTKDLHLAVGDALLPRSLGPVRRDLGIDPGRLREWYARERAALPGTLASQRLPLPAGSDRPAPIRPGRRAA